MGGSAVTQQPRKAPAGTGGSMQGRVTAPVGGLPGGTKGGSVGPSGGVTGGPMQTRTTPGTTSTTATTATQTPVISATTQRLLDSTAASGMSPGAVTSFVNGLGIRNNQSLSGFMGDINANSRTGAFGGADNPFAQAYIEQAQRQTMQNLEETLSRSLPGRFTQAGQLVQPGGSSAFDRAAAIATRGATQEMGDIATRIQYQALADAQAREAAAMEGFFNRGAQADARYDQAVQQQLDRALQVPGIEAQVSQIGSQITSQEIDNLIKNLQAQALPRLIQEMGIDRGIEAFQNQINSMLAVMGIQAGVTAPVIGNQSSSSSGGFNLK